MDLGSVIGIVAGFLVILGALVVDGGSLGSVIQPKALLIVIGGTFAAGMVNFPFSVISNSFKELKSVFWTTSPNYSGVIENICEVASIIRQEGELIMQNLIPAIRDPLLRKSLQVAVDIKERKQINEIFEAHLKMEEDKGLVVPIFFESLGGYAPTFGIIGAVIGLIQVMGSIESPVDLGYGISTAFVATLYGVGAANLVFLPIAGRLRYNLGQQLLYKKIITQGILYLHKGENPSLIREKLLSYV